MNAHRFSLLRQLLWAITIGIGFGIIWVLVLAWIGSAVQEAWLGGNVAPYEQLIVKADGTLLIQTLPQETSLRETVRDLAGQVQEAPERGDQITAVTMVGESSETGFLDSRPTWSSRLLFVVNEREPNVNWYFVHDGRPDGAGYFVGYELTSNRRIGFIGLSGFRASTVPPADWIPARGEPTSSIPFSSVYSGRIPARRLDPLDVPPRWVYLASGNVLRKVDLAERTVTTVYESKDPIVSVGVPWLANWSMGRLMKPGSIFVRTTQQILEFDQQFHATRAFTIATDLDRRSPVHWYEEKSGQAIAVFDRLLPAGEPRDVRKQMAYRIASDGTIQEQFEFGLKTGEKVPGEQIQAFGIALLVPAPAVLLVVDYFRKISFDGESYLAAIPAMIKQSGPSLLAALALSSMLAFLAWKRSRAFGLSRNERIAWAGFVLLLGLPAYVGFLLARRWPVRLPCPSCQVRVPRDRAGCAECGSRFPEPALRGNEIFA
jgi:hypothetical protein